MTWSIFLPTLPKGLNASGGAIRKHWSARSKEQKSWDLALICVTKEAGPAPDPPLRLVYTRHYARQPMDLDNAAASLKQPLDALVRSGAIEDDAPHIIAELVVKQTKVPKVADQGITITLEPIK